MSLYWRCVKAHRFFAMTERLYYSDATLRAFDATLLACEPRGKQFAAQLDRSAFYPGGGGQLCDTGTLSAAGITARVLEALPEGEEIIHVLDRALPAGAVHGELDWDRRHDLSQQHTGQHILSQAFYTLCRAETISVHMTADNCTLDLPRQVGLEDQYRAEELANRIVQEDRPVIAKFVGDEDLARMPLRKPPAAKHTQIRIVEVGGFDWSACGGTHVPTTGAL